MHEYHVYCDESCHIQHDHQQIMVLGAVWCPAARASALAQDIRAIKIQHGLAADFEIKWTKVSPGALPFYREQNRGLVAFLVTAFHVDYDSTRRSLRVKYQKRQKL